MDLLNKLTKKNLKLNKKRTIVTIIGIILSIALLTAVSTVYMSGLKSLEDYEIKVTGNYHFMIGNVNSSEKERIKLIDSVEKVSESKLIGYAKIDSQNKDKPYAAITEFDKNALNTIAFKRKKGRLPKND
jgi:putative ABC transport system permease protein